MHTGSLLVQVHTKGITTKTSENMIERSRVRTLHCLQHRLGSGSHGEDVLQQPQWLFVGQGCLQTLLRNGSLELSHSGCRVKGGASPSSRHPGVTSDLMPSRRGGRKTYSPLLATFWSLTFLSTTVSFSPAFWGGIHMSSQVSFHSWHFRHGLRLEPGQKKAAPE